MPNQLYKVIENPIQTEEVIRKVESRNAGAITVFIGTVREMTNGKRTLYLEYQAYKTMAEKKLMKLEMK